MNVTNLTNLAVMHVLRVVVVTSRGFSKSSSPFLKSPVKYFHDYFFILYMLISPTFHYLCTQCEDKRHLGIIK